jgi:hypothetical protein
MISSKPKKKPIPATHSLGAELRKQLELVLAGGEAHTGFDAAVKDFPAKLRGVVPQGLPYSAWQLLEHMRIAQRDILDFCRNADASYKPLRWPQDYWPKSPGPPTEHAWDDCVRQIGQDRATFEKVLHSVDNPNLVRPFPWGDGQSLLREAFLIADHQAYHLGELIVVRRLLGAWKS